MQIKYAFSDGKMQVLGLGADGTPRVTAALGWAPPAPLRSGVREREREREAAGKRKLYE